MLYKSLTVVGNVKREAFAALAKPDDFILTDKGIRQLEFRLYQRVITRHIVIFAIQVAVKYESDFGNVGIRVKFIFDKVTALAAGLDAMSPLKVLARGYSVAQKEGAVVKSVKDIKAGDGITLSLADGSVDCTVTEVNENG